MPGEVRVTHSMRGEESDPARVGQTSREDQSETCQWHALQNLRSCNYHQPAHHQIKYDRQPYIARAEKSFLDQADQRQSPHQTKQRPAPRPAHHAQSEWRVGSGNQNENCAVIQNTKETLRFVMCERVIKSRW